MAGSFSVGALALAAERANAVGAVRLTLAPERLEIELLRVGSFHQSFIPGALVEMVRFSVPYLAVRGLVRRGPMVCLALDPTVACPFNRFTLSRFTDAPLDALVGAHRARVRARMATLALPLPIGVLASLLVPQALAAGALGRLAVGLVVALVSYLALRELAAWAAFGGPISRYFRDAFEVRLAERLCIAPQDESDEPFEPSPALVARAQSSLPLAARRSPDSTRSPASSRPPASARPPASTRSRAHVSTSPPSFVPPSAPSSKGQPRSVSAPARPGETLPAAQAGIPLATFGAGATFDRVGWGARPRAGWVGPVAAAAFAVLCTLGILAFLGRYGGSDSPIQALLPAPEPAALGVAEAARGVTEREIVVPAKYPRCACTRADSPLWREGLPELSVLVSSPLDDDAGKPRGDIAPQPDEDGVFRYDFDLSIVNNTNRDLHDIRTVLTFARRSSGGQRTGVTDRGLFWEGALGPGRAVKWNVQAPGTEVRIDTDISRTLAEGEAGPADRFFRLTSANQRVVRLHGALMLAYVGDPRARSAAMSLGTLSEGEEKIRARILRAIRPLKVCSPEIEEDAAGGGRAVSVCAFNGTTAVKRGLVVREVASDGAAAGGLSVVVDDVLPVHEGLRLTLPLPPPLVPEHLRPELGGDGDLRLPEELELVEPGSP